jgi:hypothetical protein
MAPVIDEDDARVADKGAAAPEKKSAPRSRAEFLERAKELARKDAAGKPSFKAELEQSRQAQEANALLTTALRELSLGRAAVALDLAERAELVDRGGGLGLVPAATQVRALVLLGRPIDAARVATRLLPAQPAQTEIVDGLLAGADAAVSVGDRGLAERLLRRALSPDNRDAARRQQAQAKLDALASSWGAKAKAAVPPR